MKTRDELETENAQLRKDITEVVTVVFGVLDIMGMLNEDKSSINPKFLNVDGHKAESPVPYIIDSVGNIGMQAMKANSSSPRQAREAKNMLSEKMWVIQNVDGLIERYLKYNELPKKLNEIRAQNSLSI
jgi:hypothetical protein